jgi:acyl-CoA synthetase (AMP-forming)/AMP-acid ligase II
MASDSGAKHLFIGRAKADELGPDALAGYDRVLLDEELDSWMAPAGARAPAFVPQPSDPFNIIYSSGTTGVPKGIVQSHLMRWRQYAGTANSYLKAGRDARALASTPLYSNTTMVAFLGPLMAGGMVRITSKFKTERWLAQAEADRTNVTMLVPVQYQRLMEEPRFDEFDLSEMELKYCTSAPFSAALKAEVLRRMPGALIEIYSMTEGGVVCILAAHEFPDKLHTVGRPAPGSELKVLDDADREVAPGEAGNLVGRSQTMMSGYRGQDDKTRESQWIDPDTGEVWQRMGDIGRIDADGFVELVGRAKDMIISGGFNIYPSDLEAELDKEDAVIESAVIGVPSDQWGETPVGFVVLKPGGDVDAVREAVNGRVGKTQRLSALHAIDEMPRSHIGKLLKTELRALVNA